MEKSGPGTRPDILISGPLRPLFDTGFPDSFVVHKAATEADLAALSPDQRKRIRGMAVTHYTMKAGPSALALLPGLEIIASFGVGYDNIDVAFARAHDIVVTHTPDVLTEEVADVALALLVATLREFVTADRFVRSGQWASGNYPLSAASLRDRKVGLVGMGRIGRAVARRLEASRVPVVYHCRHPVKAVAYRHYPDLIAMARLVDTLIVIVPGGPATQHLIDAEVLSALGSGGVLINVARGSVVDQAALIEALRSETICAAGLDVFADEPAVPEALIKMDNVVLLPHIGSASMFTRNAMDQLVIDNLKAWFAGNPPLTPVPETPVRKR